MSETQNRNSSSRGLRLGCLKAHHTVRLAKNSQMWPFLGTFKNPKIVPLTSNDA